MKAKYKGFEIECSRQEAVVPFENQEFKANYVRICKPSFDGGAPKAIGYWFDGKVKDGVASAKAFIDKKLYGSKLG